MEEVLKKIYVKINFLFKKHFKKDVLISQIEKEIKVIGKDGKEEIRYLVNGEDNNHFAKDLIKAGQQVYKTDPKYALEGFKVLNEESKSLGIKIYNATRGGKLEVFKRVKLEDVI